ncbi:MAG: hypothetical protein QW304_09295 [Thermoproteota archaeon]
MKLFTATINSSPVSVLSRIGPPESLKHVPPGPVPRPKVVRVLQVVAVGEGALEIDEHNRRIISFTSSHEEGLHK